MKVNLLIISCAALIFSFNGIAQQLPDQLRSWLSSNELSKIKKANIRIDQGEQILFSQQLRNIEDSIPHEKLNYLTLSKNLFINKKTGRLLLQTKEYFASGYDSKLKIFKTYLDHFLKTDSTNSYPKAHALNDSIDIYISDARFFRDKSEIKGNLIAAANAIHQSNINLQSAVVLCEKALVLIKSEEIESSKSIQNQDYTETKTLVIEKSPEIKQKETTAIKQKDEIKDNTIAKANTETNKTTNVSTGYISKSDITTKNEIINEPAGTVDDIYFTVQILADRKPVSNVKIKSVYKGQLPIIENQGDGWYRYSFGKFSNYGSAKKALQNSNTNGYVVAYKNKTRISVREAITHLQHINQ